MTGKKWIRIAAVFCGLLLLVGAQCLSGFGFVRPAVLLGLNAGLCLGLAISGFGALQRRHQGGWRKVRWFGGGLALLVVSVPMAEGLNERERRRAVAATAPLLSAMEQFQALYGRYPASIADLIPQYLAASPRPAFMGTAPVSLQSTPEKFIVYFEVPDWQRCAYDSVSRKWTLSD